MNKDEKRIRKHYITGKQKHIIILKKYEFL